MVKTKVLLKNISDYGAMDEVCKEFLTVNEPYMSAYQVVALHLGALIETEATAIIWNIAIIFPLLITIFGPYVQKR